MRDDPTLFPALANEPASPVHRVRSGWSSWARGKCMIYHWYGPTRQVHWPKLNKTDHYQGDVFVGETTWGIHGYRWRMKRPEKGAEPYKRDPVEFMARVMKAFLAHRAQKQRERAEKAR